jgi:hypothetical protein
MDELAATAGADAIQFRLDRLTDQNLANVLRELRTFSRWETRPSGAKLGSGDVVRGRGVALTGSSSRTVATSPRSR